MKAFIYDMDGVIVDSEPVHLRVEQQILARQGVKDTTIEHLEKYQGSSDINMWQDLVEKHHLKFPAEKFVEAKKYLFNRTMEEEGATPIPGALELYVAKPFSTRELLARVKAVLRRAQPPKAAGAMQLSAGPLVMDLNAYTASVDGRALALTPKEYELLKLFLTNAGRAFSRDELLEKVWGYEYYGDTRTVDVHVRHLRAKLGVSPAMQDTIETVRGVGYRFVRP